MVENNVIIFTQIIVAISFCVSIYIVSKIIIFYLVTIKKWVKTEATVVECEANWFRSKTDSDTEGWKEMIKYNYTVNSIEYESNCVTKNLDFLTPSKIYAKNYNFRKQQKIEIYYDPSNPKNGIIDSKLNSFTIIIPITFYIIIYFILFNH
ncbi:MAG TPA: DUF3592 domain-containing protein [Flavobacterium sp.]|uniref:DUF3592 domain-containing protein n=1 Tax=Flavobacterium sp. TaxID=239 RepID=UPI002DB67A6A|nr:DUF3592 domain-containing protein [Flavobacterium sp.]HEU4788640.1 DUF3592 domain-containing protein [Flavobacterium sp.]